jgi:hypothetical protein
LVLILGNAGGKQQYFDGNTQNARNYHSLSNKSGSWKTKEE